MKYKLLVLLIALPLRVEAQPGPAALPQSARDTAPVDVTGYWVALVTNEWRWRMITPPKGDYAVLPINAEARRIADTWDPARDEADGEACRAYGAAVVMQLPARFHITWQDDNTLRMDVDNGSQTRLFHFSLALPAGGRTWQGHSIAEWLPARGRAREGRLSGQQQEPQGTLRAVTTQLRPGYLRKNGVPYSGDAVVTEHFTPFSGPGGEYLNVNVVVEDPQYLNQPYIRSMQLRREPNGSKWHPEPCTAH